MTIKDTSIDYEDMVDYNVDVCTENALEKIISSNIKKQIKIKKTEKEKGFEEENSEPLMNILIMNFLK
jgi:hypothetical protein